MKKLLLTITFLFMFCANVSAQIYLGTYDNTQFFVDETSYQEHNNITYLTLISMNTESTIYSNTKIDTHNQMFCMYHNFVITPNKQYEQYSNIWYLYDNDCLIQYALDAVKGVRL